MAPGEMSIVPAWGSGRGWTTVQCSMVYTRKNFWVPPGWKAEGVNPLGVGGCFPCAHGRKQQKPWGTEEGQQTGTQVCLPREVSK